MTVFSYHLVKVPLNAALKLLLFPIKQTDINGLIHAEVMSAMVLGSPLFSKSRLFNRKIIVFAQWENETFLDDFLRLDKTGKLMAKGWHIRLEYLRKWGSISGFKIPDWELTVNDLDPVVAVTIARMKYTQIPRFLKWGRPVEKQVRDNANTTISLASIRYPILISTFSIWKTQKAMTDMVSGHSNTSRPKAHLHAMKERDRKDFHFEFTTLRFRALSEHGQWNNLSNYIPKSEY